MNSIKDYDRFVCTAVRNNPLEFIDLLRDAARKTTDKNTEPLLLEASCVIANLMDQLGIPDKRGFEWRGTV